MQPEQLGSPVSHSGIREAAGGGGRPRRLVAVFWRCAPSLSPAFGPPWAPGYRHGAWDAAPHWAACPLTRLAPPSPRRRPRRPLTMATPPSVEALADMFPTLSMPTILDVVDQCGNNYETAMEQMLAMTAGANSPRPAPLGTRRGSAVVVPPQCPSCASASKANHAACSHAALSTPIKLNPAVSGADNLNEVCARAVAEWRRRLSGMTCAMPVNLPASPLPIPATPCRHLILMAFTPGWTRGRALAPCPRGSPVAPGGRSGRWHLQAHLASTRPRRRCLAQAGLLQTVR